MKLLAIETATEACSVAVLDHDESTQRHDVIERFEIAPRRHAELVLPWCDAVLTEVGIKKTQLDAIAVSRGPGAFTGVRLGISIAQGLALALDRPVIALSTLQVLAMRAFALLSFDHAQQNHIVAAIDARMDEIYIASYQSGHDLLHLQGSEHVITPADAALPDQQAVFAVGTGLAAVNGVLAKRLHDVMLESDASALPHAADLATLAVAAWKRGEAVAPELIEPAYLRNQVALTLQEQKRQREKARS